MEPRYRHVLVALVLTGLYLWSARGADVSVMRLITGFPAMFDLLGRMWPPDLAFLVRMIGPMVETLQMALVGTTAGAVMAIPSVLLAAQTTNRFTFVRIMARGVMNAVRTQPDLLLAAVFVALLGVGPPAGVAALAFFSYGLIAKLAFEALENIDPRPLEAVRAVGAPWGGWVVHAVVPQALPHFVAVVLYVFEVNVRIATILGLVGAGGIGLWLMRTLSFFQYDKALAIILLTLAVVVFIDRANQAVRRRLA